jgi:hypothetical protein
MQSTTITKITTGTLAVFLAGAIGVGIHQTNQTTAAQRTATAWQQEAAGWQAVASSTQIAHDTLGRQYNQQIVAATPATATDSTQGASAAVAPVAIVTQNPAPVAPTVQAAPAQAPTSQAS